MCDDGNCGNATFVSLAGCMHAFVAAQDANIIMGTQLDYSKNLKRLGHAARHISYINIFGAERKRKEKLKTKYDENWHTFSCAGKCVRTFLLCQEKLVNHFVALDHNCGFVVRSCEKHLMYFRKDSSPVGAEDD